MSGQSVEKSWGQRHISLLVVLAAFPMAILCTRTIPPLNGEAGQSNYSSLELEYLEALSPMCIFIARTENLDTSINRRV